jgi:uncharacterized PurR-regulated membrane protein YhhQ (DUF165 family)
MIAIVTASNYLVEIPINEWLTWGALSYPLSFLVTEVTNFHWGAKEARRVVYAGFIVAALIAFSAMNKQIAAASCLAFLVSQLLDVSIFSALRQRSWWLAPICASVLASTIDTFIFFFIAFFDHGWLKLALGDLAVKVAVDLALLMPFRVFYRRNLVLNAH